MVSLSVRGEILVRAKCMSPRKSMNARWRGGRQRRRESFGIPDPRTLHDRINTVGGHVLERFCRAIRPANLDGFHFFRRAEAKVEAQIVLREITSSAVDFIELFDTCRANRYARADRRAIALVAYELEEHSM